MPLQRIKSLFEECFCEAGVFSREVPGAALFETEVLKKGKKDWVVIAAGVTDDEAGSLFPGNPNRADRATKPVNLIHGGQLAVRFVLRPFEARVETLPPLPLITPFAPGRDMPFVEVLQGSFFRPSGLDGAGTGLENFRWELDVGESQRQPLEVWLRPWAAHLHHNPAHAPSHLHFNSPPLDPKGHGRAEHPSGDLRLSVGLPNPLALILSFATWLRAY